MANTQPEARLRLLRDLATTTTTSEWGREGIQGLLDQEPGAADADCPRFVALTEHAGERRLLCCDDPEALTKTLAELAVEELPQSAEAVVDLDTGARHAAATRASVTFTPPLPRTSSRPDGAERQATLTYGHRGALRLAAEIVAEHAREPGDRKELTDTVDWLEDLLSQWAAAAPGLTTRA